MRYEEGLSLDTWIKINIYNNFSFKLEYNQRGQDLFMHVWLCKLWNPFFPAILYYQINQKQSKTTQLHLMKNSQSHPYTPIESKHLF